MYNIISRIKRTRCFNKEHVFINLRSDNFISGTLDQVYDTDLLTNISLPKRIIHPW